MAKRLASEAHQRLGQTQQAAQLAEEAVVPGAREAPLGTRIHLRNRFKEKRTIYNTILYRYSYFILCIFIIYVYMFMTYVYDFVYVFLS